MSCFVRDKTDAEGKLLKIKARLVAGGHLQGLVHYKVCSDALVCLLTRVRVASSISSKKPSALAVAQEKSNYNTEE